MLSPRSTNMVLALFLFAAAFVCLINLGSVAGVAASAQAAFEPVGHPCDQNQKVAPPQAPRDLPADCGLASPSNMSTQGSEEKGFGRRTCRCSCGYPCKTNADCGGAACVAGISCC